VRSHRPHRPRYGPGAREREETPGKGGGGTRAAGHEGQDGGGHYWPRRKGGEGIAAALMAALKAGSGGEGAERPRAHRRPAARAAWGGEEASGWRLGMTPTGGVHLEVREGEGGVGWAGRGLLGRLGRAGKEKKERRMVGWAGLVEEKREEKKSSFFFFNTNFT